jgi:hypothetical protein
MDTATGTSQPTTEEPLFRLIQGKAAINYSLLKLAIVDGQLTDQEAELIKGWIGRDVFIALQQEALAC